MGARRLYRVASPYNAEELPEIDFVQKFDVVYLAHINHDPTKLQRLDHTDWQFVTVTFGPTIEPPSGVAGTATDPNQDADNDGNAFFAQPDVYVVTAIDALTGQESRASAEVTLTNDLSLKRNYNTVTWNAVAGADRYRVYKAHNGHDLGLAGATTELTFRDDNIGADLTLGPPAGYTPFPEDRDRPSTVTFFEERLWWARSLNNPNALYGSRSADFENMDRSVPLRGDDGIAIRLVSQGVNQANQLVPMDNLMVFSSDGIIKIEGANEDYLAASPPPRQRKQSGTGSSRLEPIVLNDIALYKTKAGCSIRAAGYSFEINGVKTDDVSIFSSHFFEGFDVVSWCYAEEPLSVVWAVRSDGKLLAFTWQKEHEVWGWTICSTPGFFLAVAAIVEIGADGLPEHRVYAVVRRTIAGVERTTRERMASAKWAGLAYECHLDCSVTRIYSEPTDVIDGLWHLEGETICAFADGVAVEGLVVSGGQVTLEFEFSVATAGLAYDADVTTLPLVFPTAGGVNVGRQQQTGKAVIKLVRSRAPMLGINSSHLRDIQHRNREPMNTEASLLTGVFEVATDPQNVGESTVTLAHRIGPLTVTGIYLDAKASGG